MEELRGIGERFSHSRFFRLSNQHRSVLRRPRLRARGVVAIRRALKGMDENMRGGKCFDAKQRSNVCASINTVNVTPIKT